MVGIHAQLANWQFVTELLRYRSANNSVDPPTSWVTTDMAFLLCCHVAQGRRVRESFRPP
jgi:hypothetical protein